MKICILQNAVEWREENEMCSEDQRHFWRESLKNLNPENRNHYFRQEGIQNIRTRGEAQVSFPPGTLIDIAFQQCTLCTALSVRKA